RTQTSGLGLGCLKGLKNLTELVPGRKVTANDLGHLKGFPRLSSIEIYNIQMSPSAWKTLAGLKLTYIGAETRQLTDEALTALAASKRLHALRTAGGGDGSRAESDAEIRSLGLAFTKVSDKGLAALQGLTALGTLWLDRGVTDKGLETLAGLGMKKLANLSLRGPNVTDARLKQV